MAFITLIERKILSFTQLRVGPNKPGFAGILQPGADAIKLFSNKFVLINSSNSLYKYTPIWALTLALALWTTLSTHASSSNYEFGILIFLIILRVSIYPLMLTGWGAKNKYTIIGSIRAIAQTISYEISLIFVIITFSITIFFLSFKQVHNLAHFAPIWSFPRLLFIWIVIILAETNRTPFDFAEGERELVSGFNTEFRASKFALIFITEYSIIYLFAFLTQIIYVLPFMLIIIFWIWIRATLPRHRYDLLISINWKIMLPLRMFGPIIIIVIIQLYIKI